MNKIIQTILLCLIVNYSFGQAAAKIFNPADNAEQGIAKAIDQAAKEGKHVFIDAGGNWCSWCQRFYQTVHRDKSLDSALNKDYIVYYLNYSPENKNAEVFKKLGFPQRFGFPVFIILDGKGNRIHTQNSEYLESGIGYDKKKIMEFFYGWRPAALDESYYYQ